MDKEDIIRKARVLFRDESAARHTPEFMNSAFGIVRVRSLIKGESETGFSYEEGHVLLDMLMTFIIETDKL